MSLQSVLWGTDFICVYCSIPAALCWARGETLWKCSLKYPSLWSICGSRVSFIFLCTYWCLFNFLRGWNVIGISILLATLSAFRNEIRYSVIGVPVWKILRDFVKGSKREMSFFFVIERFTFTIKISFAISFIKMNIILAEMKRPLDSWN